MNTSKVIFSGFGLCSSLGGYKDACAAYRAGLNRFASHAEIKTMLPGDDEPVALTVAPAASNVFVYQGLARTVKMLQLAYCDLLDNLQQDIPQEDIALLFAMPDPLDRELDMDSPDDLPRDQRLQQYVDAMTKPLFDVCSDLKNIPMQCSFGDRVAFARIFNKAVKLLASGKTQHCLLVITDSLLSDPMLQVQLENNALKTDDNPVGYIPGEGAAMILLSQKPLAEKSSMTVPNANVAVSIDSKTLDQQAESLDDEQQLRQLERASWHGEKLVSVLTEVLLPNYDNTLFPQHVSDINGEEYRALELGNTQVKLKLIYPNTTFVASQIPALGFGEVGTMMGPIALMTVVAAIQRGYVTQNEFLITLSEESGKRAAIKLLFSESTEEV